MKRIALVFLILTTISLSSCNTVSGLGQDMQDLGKSITGSAK